MEGRPSRGEQIKTQLDLFVSSLKPSTQCNALGFRDMIILSTK
jgi:hypothetical protein